MATSGQTESAHLYFDPDSHPKDTLKQFREFCRRFHLRYDAHFPDPPKSSMDTAVARWVVTKTTATNQNPKPDLDEYDAISEAWRSKDKVKKVLGMFSSPRLSSDWEAAETNQQTRQKSTWDQFKTKMEAYYAPTENATLMNYQFRELIQKPNETFPSFCNRVESEAKFCHFKCANDACTAEEVAVRDQIIIGTTNNKIREEALMKSWALKDLRVEGMKLESASRGEAEISGSAEVNKLGRYSYSNIRSQQTPRYHDRGKQFSKEITCYNCDEKFTGPASKHKESCKAKSSKCSNCGKWGHYPKCCRSKPVRFASTENQDKAEQPPEPPIYHASLFRVTSLQYDIKHTSPVNNEGDFSVNVVANGSLAKVVADTGAKVSVCGSYQAKKWKLMEKMVPTSAKIKPYNSEPIPVAGIAKCAVTFGTSSIPVDWYIITGSCEPILSGNAAVQLGIINFT